MAQKSHKDDGAQVAAKKRITELRRTGHYERMAKNRIARLERNHPHKVQGWVNTLGCAIK